MRTARREEHGAPGSRTVQDGKSDARQRGTVERAAARDGVDQNA
jgi:hypothetical protein